MEEIDARKEQYRAQKTSFYRPWVFMLTDGGANDDNNGAFEALKQWQLGKYGLFFPVAIGNKADKTLLKGMQKDGVVLTASMVRLNG